MGDTGLVSGKGNFTQAFMHKNRKRNRKANQKKEERSKDNSTTFIHLKKRLPINVAVMRLGLNTERWLYPYRMHVSVRRTIVEWQQNTPKFLSETATATGS